MPCPSETNMQRNERGGRCLIPLGKQPWRGHVAGYKNKGDESEVEKSRTSSEIRVRSGWATSFRMRRREVGVSFRKDQPVVIPVKAGLFIGNSEGLLIHFHVRQ